MYMYMYVYTYNIYIYIYIYKHILIHNILHKQRLHITLQMASRYVVCNQRLHITLHYITIGFTLRIA